MAAANSLFERRCPAVTGGPGAAQPPLLALGMLQWGEEASGSHVMLCCNYPATAA